MSIKITTPLQNVEFEEFTFPGGEIHIKIKDLDLVEGEDTMIEARVTSPEEFLKIPFICNALRNAGSDQVFLAIPYFPGARQDRICNPGEALSVKVYAEIINQCDFATVLILDPHSDVTPALINNVLVIPAISWLNTITTLQEVDDVIIPDSGATKRVFSLVKEMGLGVNLIQCEKHRDLSTGKISGFRILDTPTKGGKAILIDDICDDDGTFMGLGKELRDHYKELSLAVTHGIFSKGLDDLATLYDHIYTTDSICSIEHEKLTVIDEDRWVD